MEFEKKTGMIQKNNFFISIGIGILFTLFVVAVFAFSGLLIADADDAQNNAPSEIVLSEDFTTVEASDLVFNNETVTYHTNLSPWSAGSFTTFNNQDELNKAAQADAARRQAAAAQANSYALNQGARNSYDWVAQQNAPVGVPTSPAPLAPGNRYAPGYCTWYAYNRRYQMGIFTGALWGNGGTWHIGAARDGVATDHSPRVGDVIDLPGHVAVVEVVGDNAVYISEMNYGGLYRYNTRWVANASQYWFIH
jgi:hypothetical protein